MLITPQEIQKAVEKRVKDELDFVIVEAIEKFKKEKIASIIADLIVEIELTKTIEDFSTRFTFKVEIK